MKFWNILWSIIKWLIKIAWKLFVLFLWGFCAFAAIAFQAASTYLKGYITAKRG